ncbi:MAG: redox-sensing transcriptional repressor Rex [Clostridia bacterium]|nr:redox-sensing transcriptional repressor Rex [Clostridia bacterium]
MTKNSIPRATLGRLPIYLDYLKAHIEENAGRISAPKIAKDLGRGEVQVRKDLSAVSDAGRPKLGYDVRGLIGDIEAILNPSKNEQAVIVGAGRLGQALLEYGYFEIYGVRIPAAFDISVKEATKTSYGKMIYPLSDLASYCAENGIKIGIITVPEGEAQSVCDLLLKAGVKAIWNFAPEVLTVPDGIALRHENLGLSLAHLKICLENTTSEMNLRRNYR